MFWYSLAVPQWKHVLVLISSASVEACSGTHQQRFSGNMFWYSLAALQCKHVLVLISSASVQTCSGTL